MTEPLLQLVDVSYRHGSDFELRDINLSIAAGERLAIVGANGSGKSTLARLISAELTPTSGKIAGSARVPDGVGTAANLMLGDAARAVADVVASHIPTASVGDVLQAVSLPADMANRRIRDLSGGERYRLAVGIQLAKRPALLVLDAPTATLDARSTADLVTALARHRGALVVLSADLTLAVEVCQRAVVMAEGAIVADGHPAELLTDTEMLGWYGIQLPSAVSPSWLRRRARRDGVMPGPGGADDAGRWARDGAPALEQVAQEVAVRVEQGFVGFHTEFQGITRRAARRFAFQEFSAGQEDASDRLLLHRRCVEATVRSVGPLLGLYDDDETRRMLWVRARHLFAHSIAWRPDSELAETYFNSVARRVFTMVGTDDDLEFRWFGGITLPVVDPGQGEVNTFRRRGTTADLVEAVLASYGFQRDWDDISRDAEAVAGAIDEHLAQTWESSMPVEIDMLAPVFYRNRGAYLVGRIRHLNRVSPLVIPLRSIPAGIQCDAVLLTENLTSRIFGFTRSYFHVDTAEPAAIVAFVKSLIPLKPVAELYTAIGHSGHGKTSLFRAIYRHLDNSTDRFEFARGVKGMVMTVFTLPSFGVVFKVIKDTFPPSKRTSRAQVMDKYRLVFKHDRVGRMVDAQVFENLAFPRDRFSDDLVEELVREAGRQVTVTDTQVIIDHVYTERRVYPLDLYVREMPTAQARAAAVDYGNAIKDLCAANIFPGDLFTKNFGVTRHGSVVFYDYDELALLDEMNFREIPPSKSYEDEMSSQPWFSIGVDDVFPEEFKRFFHFPESVRTAFFGRHGDLCEADTWRALQGAHNETVVPEFFPYPDEVRLWAGSGVTEP